MEKEKTVEVTLSKRHTVGDVEYSKGDIVEVNLSSVPFLEDFGVIEDGSMQPAGTQKRLQDEEVANKQAALQARINAFDKDGNIDLSKPPEELAKLKPATDTQVSEVAQTTTGKKKENT